jgi:hypothetical protein
MECKVVWSGCCLPEFCTICYFCFQDRRPFIYHFCHKHCKLILELKILHLRNKTHAGKLEITEAYMNNNSSWLIDVCVCVCVYVCYKAIWMVSNRQRQIHNVSRIEDVEN